MTKGLRRALYLSCGLLTLTGAAYAAPLYADRWFFLDLSLPLRPALLMAIHGLVASLIWFLCGLVWQTHARIRLRIRPAAPTGLLMLAILPALGASGYLLYYAADEELRQWLADIHTACGLVWPVLLLGHGRAGR